MAARLDFLIITMGNIPYKTIEELRRTIRESNKDSICGSQRYVYWENKAIQSDYEFIDCKCTDGCWCKRNGCIGHYRIKEIDFGQFLNTYVSSYKFPDN